jgi:hypothetical protein
MPTDHASTESVLPGAAQDRPAEKRPLPPAAERALAEAAARRDGLDRRSSGPPNEVGGPAGPEPTRYGDWEINGIASDF